MNTAAVLEFMLVRGWRSPPTDINSSSIKYPAAKCPCVASLLAVALVLSHCRTTNTDTVSLAWVVGVTVSGYYGTHREGENWFRKELIAVTITFVRRAHKD